MPTRAKDMAYVNHHQQLTVNQSGGGREREAISCTANCVTMRLFKNVFVGELCIRPTLENVPDDCESLSV
jgi:hypothetical protein